MEPEKMRSTSPSPLGGRTEMMSLMFYAVVLLVTLSTQAATFTRYPLFPPDRNDIGWSNAWLLAKTIDYYGICMCFCGIVLSTEESWRTAIAWIISCCVIGSPACCLYVFLWLTKESGSLRLERTEASPPVIGCSNKPKESSKDEETGSGGGGVETKSGIRPTVTSTVAIAASHACVGLMKGSNPSTPKTHQDFQDDTIVSTTSTSSTIDHHNPASISSSSNNNNRGSSNNSRNHNNNNVYHPQPQLYREQPYPQYQQRQQSQPKQQQRHQEHRQQQQQQQRQQPLQQQPQQRSDGNNRYRPAAAK